MKKAYMNRILVEVKKEKDVTTSTSGLIIKEEKSNVTTGKVLSIGSKVEDITVDSSVTFLKHEAVEVSKDIYAVLDENVLSVEQ